MKRNRRLNLLLKQKRKKDKKIKNKLFQAIYLKQLKRDKEFNSIVMKIMNEKLPGFNALCPVNILDSVSEFTAFNSVYNEIYK